MNFFKKEISKRKILFRKNVESYKKQLCCMLGENSQLNTYNVDNESNVSWIFFFCLFTQQSTDKRKRDRPSLGS